MALDTVVYTQEIFGNGGKEIYTLGSSSGWGYEFGLQEDHKTFIEVFENSMEQSVHGNNWDQSPSSSMIMLNVKEYWDHNSSPEPFTGDHQLPVDDSSNMAVAPPPAAPCRRKRRRAKSCKNKEELENQRMTHIAVERNRRKQVNEHLAVIRSLMPTSYVQRGDQASIIGGAINFVKELEQQLQTLEVQKRAKQQPNNNGHHQQLFADFFTFPQYSSTHSAHHETSNSSSSSLSTTSSEPMAENLPAALADIEVTMVESHANLKILKKRRPRQLSKIVAGLQCLCLTVLHLNVTSIDQMVLYCLSLKLEDGCQLTTADEIADAVYHLLGRTQEESAFNLMG